jgi:hypothetical protein
MSWNMIGSMMLVAVAQIGLAAGGRADTTWLCCVNSAVSVDEDGTIGPPELGERERPTFFRVNAATKELTLVAPQSRRGEVTKLDMAHECEGSWVFSGMENGRGVNLIITEEGRMTLSVVGDGVIWSVFGHALSEEVSAGPELAETAAVDQASTETAAVDQAATETAAIDQALPDAASE